MIEIVTRHNTILYKDALREMFRMRHSVFVEKMGWAALRKPDGLERDQFDNEDAVYLLMLDDGTGRLIGSHRALPTVKPHLFSEIFPEFCNVRGIQVGPKIYELSRSCSDETHLTKDRVRWARKRLMAGFMEFCVKAGLESFTVMGRMEIISLYMRMGWSIRPLGIPRECDGSRHIGAIVSTTKEALEAVRRAYHIEEDLVSCVGPGAAISGLIELPEMPADSPAVIH
jgi:acyl-homoserine lactone synthase